MKTKKLGIIFPKEVKKIMEIVRKTPEKCQMYEFKEGKYFQHNPFHGNELEEFSIEFKYITLNEQFCTYITSIIMEAHKRVPNIKTSDPDEPQQYGVKHDGKIDGVVSALVNRYSYEDSKNSSLGIFDFISSLLYRIVKAHAFHNGNKRTAILSISMILDFFGYYIAWSNRTEAYIRFWEKLMIKVAATEEPEEKITKEIKEKIIKFIWLKL